MKGRVFCVVLTAWLMALVANGQEKTEKVVVNVEPTPFNGLVCNQMNEDARRYAVSDRKGRFGLTNVSPDDTLHVVVKKLQYDIPVAGRKSIKLRLMDQQSYKAEEDQHLVDVGYGYVKRREHTGVSNGISGLGSMSVGRDLASLTCRCEVSIASTCRRLHCLLSTVLR